MNPAHDTLYRVHQVQAEQLGEAALPYDEFRARLLKGYQADLTGLLPPPLGSKLRIQITVNTRFSLGSLCITPNLANAVQADELVKAVERHAAGDWGNVNETAWQENDNALRSRGRLFSSYASSSGKKFWVTTTADRSVTTISLPEDR